MRLQTLLASALGSLALACATVPPTPAGPATSRFRILQINDVYKIEGLAGGQIGGLARVRTLRTHLESDGTPVLVIHGGDALYPSVMSKYLEARPIVDVMNLLDGSATAFDPNLIVTFGNHEFDNRDARILLARLGESSFQWLSTNAHHCNPGCTQPFPGAKRTLLVDVAGTPVGLFGVLYPMEKSYVKATNVEEAARTAVDELRRGGARVVVAVTHQDMTEDRNLVAAVPGIDLVIGGHDHLFMQDRVGSTWITKADADAKSAIVYDITVPSSGSIRTVPVRVVLDSTVARDAVVDASVRKWMGELAAKLGGNEVLGRTRNTLEGVEPAVRGRETALGNLLTDVARAQMETDIAILNGGSIRINDDIPPGPITSYEMEGIFYFRNRLVAFTATGSDVLEMLNNSVSRADSGDGRFLQVSGLRFRYGKRGDAFVVDPADVEVGGSPLELGRSYTIATIDYLHERGEEDGYALFGNARRPPKVHTEREADFRTTVEAAIRRAEVTTAIEGRIVRK